MRNVLQIAFAGVLLCISSAASHADPAAAWVHAFMAKPQPRGVALAVIRDRKVVKAWIYGYANLEWQQPVARNSLFWLDSLTKLFTAVGVMQLGGRGRGSL